MSADVCEDAVSAFKDVVQICPALFAKSVAQPHRNLYSADTVAGEAYMQTQSGERDAQAYICSVCPIPDAAWYDSELVQLVRLTNIISAILLE
jgi:hypothetical protein